MHHGTAAVAGLYVNADGFHELCVSADDLEIVYKGFYAVAGNLLYIGDAGAV